MQKLQTHEKARGRPHRHSAEVIGHPRQLLDKEFDHYDPQAQSLLYGKLPLELREMIFEPVFGSGVLEFYIKPRDSVFTRETRLKWHNWNRLDSDKMWTRKGPWMVNNMYGRKEPWDEGQQWRSSRKKFREIGALVATCRRVFIDTRTLLFPNNWLYPHSMLSLHKLHRCIPVSSFQSITHLRIRATRSWPSVSLRESSTRRALRKYPTLQLYLVREFPQVKHLELVFEEVCIFTEWIELTEGSPFASVRESLGFFHRKKLTDIRQLMKPPSEGTLKSYTFLLPLTDIDERDFKDAKRFGAYLRVRDGGEEEFLTAGLRPFPANYLKQTIEAAKQYTYRMRKPYAASDDNIIVCFD